MEEENEGNQIPVPSDNEGFEEREADTGEEQVQNQTLVTSTIEVIPTDGVLTSSTEAFLQKDWLF